MTNTKMLTMVPAQPGFFVLMPVYDGENVVDFRTEPVVAWAVVPEDKFGATPAHATPILHGTWVLENEPYAVLEPDGRVFTSIHGIFDSVGEYMLYLKE